MYSCESMEDTYSEYKGDGMERYVGKCSNIKVEKGWKRLKLTWENSIDPIVKSIRITWKSDVAIDSVDISPELNTYTTQAILENKSYELNVYAVDANGNKSLSEPVYERPLSNEHEIITNFGHIENKYFYLNDKLIILWNIPNENVFDRKITYYQNGQPKEQELTAETLTENNGVFVIDNVDSEKDVAIYRSAKIEDCIDDIVFQPYNLERGITVLNGSFSAYIKRYYDVETISADLINSITELYLNEDIESIEDILYFPNLKKIILGGERYLHPGHNNYKAEFKNKEISLFALNTLHAEKPFELEVYIGFYEIDPGSLNFSFSEYGLPDYSSVVNLLDTDSWVVTINFPDDNQNTDPNYLIDNDQSTVWMPDQKETESRIHEIIIDMKDSKSVKGLLFKQPEAANFLEDYFADAITILKSEDLMNWDYVYNLVEKKIYRERGETNLIKFPDLINARYFKIIVKDQISTRRNICIADILPFN